jgi:hypothetical protein
MRKQRSVNTVVCSEYQKLLEGSERSLEIWNERRADVLHSRLTTMEAGDELLGLQAKFARAYTLLQNHVHNCMLCQSVKRIEGRDSENNSDTLSDFEIYV